MGERLTFGIDTPERVRHMRADQPATMFPDGVDLPLFSGTPIPAIERPFVPEDHRMKQGMLPGMPPIDYTHVLEKDRTLRRRRTPVALPEGSDIFTATAPLSSAPPAAASEPVEQPGEAPGLPAATHERRQPPRNRTEKLHPLREALSPYLDFSTLRQLAAQGEDLAQAYIGSGDMPPEVRAVLDTLALLLRPVRREQVKSPQDIAAVFMLELTETFCRCQSVG